jgi:cytochrome c556
MQTSKLIMVVAAVASSIAAGAWVAAGEPATAATEAPRLEVSHGVPATLDALYPPQAKQPEYLMRMLRLGSLMTGVAVDLTEQDVEHAAGTFAAFRSNYLEVAALVPEWRERFPVEPVDALGEALASGDPARVGPAFGAVGAVCSSCHHGAMPAVAARYHWPNAMAISATDPVSGERVSHAEFMHQLDFSLTGITHDLGQGQVEAARAHYQDFSRRFAALAETCEDCHGTEERHYFTDPASAAKVEAIGAALSAEIPDPAAVQGAVMEVGHNTCFRCHLVHVPAAFAKLAQGH